MTSTKPIYVVMTISSISTDSYGMAHIKGSRVVGFFYDKSEAVEAVTSNAADINEFTYDYAVIEEVDPGFYPCSQTRWFYQFDLQTSRYISINEPNGFSNLCALTMG